MKNIDALSLENWQTFKEFEFGKFMYYIIPIWGQKFQSLKRRLFRFGNLYFAIPHDKQHSILTFQPVSKKIPHYSSLNDDREIPSMDLEMILVFDENSVAPRRVGDVDDFAAVHLSSVVYGLGEFRVKAFFYTTY